MKKHAKKIIPLLLVVALLIPTVGMIFSSATDNRFPVELAYNNLFVFEKWANNKLSTTIQPLDEANPYGKVESNVTAGSTTITLLRNAPDSYGGIFTAHSGDTKDAANNQNYYTIDVEPNTTYSFSYVLESSNLSSFVPYVFYFDDKNLAVPTPGNENVGFNSLGVAANLNGSNTWNFTTPAAADHIQIRFTVGNSADGNVSTATVKDIIIYESELVEPENIFDFSEWASNDNSNGLAASYSLGNGTADINSSDASIYFEATGGLFTNFIINGNSEGYYTMPVKPYTTYSVSYDLINSNLVQAGVAIAWHEANGDFIEYHNIYSYNSNGNNYHTFNTPAEAAYMQVAFGAFHSGTTGSGTMKNIKFCDLGSIFCLGEWAANGKSNSMLPGFTGTLTANAKDNVVTYTSTSYGNAYFTNYDLSSCANFYTVDIEPNTTYTFSYDLAISNASGPVYFQPYFAEFTEDGSFTGLLYNYMSAAFGKNQYTFTTGNNSSRLMVVFSFHHTDPTKTGDCTWSIKDMTLCLAQDFEDITGAPHRQVFTYDHSRTDSNFYGDLPEATAPEGYVFGGWYTADGERITPETKIKYESFSVFPKFERKVDSLEIATYPTNLIYTVGEKLNTAGLSLKATVNGSSFNINSDFNCTPVYLNTVGTQPITVSYGGKTVTFNVTVKENSDYSIIFNGVEKTVLVANKNYVINEDVSAFNRYEIAYSTNSYVKGVITFNGGHSEEFFLEPSDNGNFASYVDEFVYDNTYNKVVAVKFTCLDNELGNFQLKAISTVNKGGYDKTVYFTNDEYKLGVSLEYGGVVSELYDTDDSVTARVYANGAHNISQVDYKDKLDENWGDNYIEQSESVNLINTLDRGRYLQQSYYGTNERPYVPGRFNSADWRYNPVQGGNVGEEPSKLVDYEITDTYVYVKARPMEWEKWSDKHAAECEHFEDHQPIYGNDVISDTYVEAWYDFDSGMIKVTNRKVDYSGFPEATTEQELPALYIVEPLNHFVYNNVSAEDAWSKSLDEIGDSLENIEEPEFWGIVDSYHEMHRNNENDKNGDGRIDVNAACYENWAAFTASEDPDSFGIGIYSPGSTDFYYGVMPQIFASTYDENGNVTGNSNNRNYRHAETVNPSPESPTSYIAPLAKLTFKSYDPTEYSYYLTTGTAEDIYSDFRSIGDKEAEVELAKTKIAVPETVYMNPADNKAPQYYVNNIMNDRDFYNVETEAKSAETDMYFGIHIDDAESFTVNVTNVTTPSNDIILGYGDNTGNREGEVLYFDSSKNDTFVSEGGFSLRLSNAIETNQTATAKWDITVTLKNGTTETYTVFTVLYTPMKTVGAVAEARQIGNSENEVSSWITGANGIDHSQRAPLGEFHGDYHDSGYFNVDPLYNERAQLSGTGGSEDDYITTDDTVGTTDDYGDNAYVLSTATNGHDGSRAQSYLGLLTVDKSRYTNTNQIPNLKIGYDALGIASGHPKNSLEHYNTYYTLGDIDSFTASKDDLDAKPSGWTQNSSHTQLYEELGEDRSKIPYRETVVPDYDVSTIDGKYIHAIAQGEAYQILIARRYSTAGTSVLCSVTDKSGLRDAVLEAYVKADDTQDDDFMDKLQEAATVLGTPSATQEQIDTARKELNNILSVEYYSLKFDNLFSAYEFSQKTAGMRMVKAEETMENDNIAVLDERAAVKYQDGTIIINSNNTSAGNYNVYTHFGPLDTYYNLPIKADTEYVFEYDVVSDHGSQAHLFFYDADGNSVSITNTSVESSSGEWFSPDPEPNKATGNEDFFGTYTGTNSNTHIVMRFTTTANVAEVAFRFGNINQPINKSTFSNIRFVEAEHYHGDAVYSKTEDVYAEHTAYGTLAAPARTGFTFLNWLYEDETTVVASTDLAKAHTTIYSEWYEHKYSITYDKNGGNGPAFSTPTNTTYTANVTLNNGSGYSRTDYVLAGWSTNASATTPDYNLGQTVNKLTPTDGATVTLYAVWVPDKVNITFDNLIDIKEWSKLTPSNATVSNVTDTGFTLTSIEPTGGEGTYSSPYFTVEAGKQYKIDIETTGAPWDVYIFFCDANGNWVDFLDGQTNRYSSYTTWEPVFTAPNKESVVKAQIRVDANEPANPVTFNNIRVYEYSIGEIDVTPANKQVIYGDAFGALPVPTREGFTFAGWYDGATLYTSASTASSRNTYFLKSEWIKNEDVLAEDNITVDFGSSVNITPLDNDAALIDVAKATDASYKIDGISKDDTTYSATVNGAYGTFSVSGNNVTYTPSKAMNNIETVFYQASITSGGITTKVTDTITVAPASNILYEDSMFKPGSGTTGVEWETTEGTALNSSQSASSVNDVYGYDDSYNSFRQYSNNSAFIASVDSTTKRSRILTFDFTGTGFDLYSACGDSTGVQIVTVKNNTTGKVINSSIVDTYYNDSDYGTLYQVPIVSITDLDHGNYTVQVAASYLSTAGAVKNADNNEMTPQSVAGFDEITAYSAAADNEILREMLAEIDMDYVLDADEVNVVWFDDDSVLNGGKGADTQKAGTLSTASTVTLLNIVDSIRVYNPIENGDDYYIESEKGAQYYNVMDNLINDNGAVSGSGEYIAYVSGNPNETVTIDNYNSIGPKDELYLSNSTNAITFTVGGFNRGTTNVMVSLRAAYGTPVAEIGRAYDEISSNTEMYYDITEYIDDNGTVTIENTSEEASLLAIGFVKITGNSAALLNTFDLETASVMMAAPSEEVVFNAPKPVTEPDVSTPEDDTSAPDDDTSAPDDDTSTDTDGSTDEDTTECKLTSIINYIVELFKKAIAFAKSLIESVVSLLRY